MDHLVYPLSFVVVYSYTVEVSDNHGIYRIIKGIRNNITRNDIKYLFYLVVPLFIKPCNLFGIETSAIILVFIQDLISCYLLCKILRTLKPFSSENQYLVGRWRTHCDRIPDPKIDCKISFVVWSNRFLIFSIKQVDSACTGQSSGQNRRNPQRTCGKLKLLDTQQGLPANNPTGLIYGDNDK